MERPKDDLLSLSEKQNWRAYTAPTDPTYFDKPGHADRSLANQPNHEKHWKKVKQRFRRTNLSDVIS